MENKRQDSIVTIEIPLKVTWHIQDGGSVLVNATHIPPEEVISDAIDQQAKYIKAKIVEATEAIWQC